MLPPWRPALFSATYCFPLPPPLPRQDLRCPIFGSFRVNYETFPPFFFVPEQQVRFAWWVPPSSDPLCCHCSSVQIYFPACFIAQYFFAGNIRPTSPQFFLKVPARGLSVLFAFFFSEASISRIFCQSHLRSGPNGLTQVMFSLFLLGLRGWRLVPNSPPPQ